MSGSEEAVFAFDADGAELCERYELSCERIRSFEYDVAPEALEYFRRAAVLVGTKSMSSELPYMHSGKTYLYPGYAREQLGSELGELMSIWCMEMTGLVRLGLTDDIGSMTRMLETFIQIYNEFELAFMEHKGLPEAASVRDIIYSYLYDYAEDMLKAMGPTQEHMTRGVPEPSREDRRMADYPAHLLTRSIFGPLGDTSIRQVGDEGKLDLVDELMLIHMDDLGAFLGDRLRARIEDAMDRSCMDGSCDDAWYAKEQKTEIHVMREADPRIGDLIQIRPHAMNQLRRLRAKAGHMKD